MITAYYTSAPFNNFFYQATVQPFTGITAIKYPGATPQNCPAGRTLNVIPGPSIFPLTITEGLGNLVNVVDTVSGFNGYIPSSNPIFVAVA
jgi:hypothetical protein